MTKMNPVTSSMFRMKLPAVALALLLAGMFVGADVVAEQQRTPAPHFLFRTSMTNTGVDANAAGTVRGGLIGEARMRKFLKISLTKLDPRTTYHLTAFLGSDLGATQLTTFTTNSKGAFAVRYVQKPDGRSGAVPLPEALTLICSVRELNIINGGGQTVLRADLTHPDRFQYRIRRPMESTGLVAGAAGDLEIHATHSFTHFHLKARGLTANTNYMLTVDGNASQSKAAGSNGSLNLAVREPGEVDAFDVHSVALTDGSGSNAVLTIERITLPCDDTTPSVSSTLPARGATGVPINSQLAVTFSEPMDGDTITLATFTLEQEGTPVGGMVSYDGVTATFDPASNLTPGATYTATIASAVLDLAGNGLADDYVWSFTAGATSDSTAPSVTSTVPADAATGVSIDANITATFSEAMDPSTITPETFLLQQGDTVVPRTVNYAGVTATVNPTESLASDTIYTATVTTGVTDLAGNAMLASRTWNFRTGNGLDTTAPTVISTIPNNGDQNVSLNQSIGATFSEDMDPLTISTASFTLTGPGAEAVTGAVTYSAQDRIATLTPVSDLEPNTLYTAKIGTGAKDLAGNALLTERLWTFRTGTQLDQRPINLGDAGTFAILATAAISGGGNHINGDVGVNPGSAQGIAPSEINGSTHVNDQAVIDAQSDLLAAYQDAVGRSLDAQTLEGNLGGLTKTPGLYENGSSTGISGSGPNAILTLDAQGDANAIFIFKMGSTLITAPGTSIVLSGGAQAKNVYWQVGSSATLDTTSIFKGNILAAVSITVNNGSDVEGRLFAGSGGGAGSVTVQSSTITVPGP